MTGAISKWPSRGLTRGHIPDADRRNDSRPALRQGTCAPVITPLIPIFRGGSEVPKQTIKGNCCRACEKTHEECAGSKTCAKWDISLYVCQMFGVRPISPRRSQALKRVS